MFRRKSRNMLFLTPDGGGGPPPVVDGDYFPNRYFATRFYGRYFG